MSIVLYSNPMAELAEEIIHKHDIQYTTALGDPDRILSPDKYADRKNIKFSECISFSNKPIKKNYYYRYHVIDPNFAEIPDGHTPRDLFFLIHNIIYQHQYKPIDVDYSTLIKGVDPKAIIGCDGVGLFRLYNKRIPILHMGAVSLMDSVVIGPNTCVARAVLSGYSTTIERDVRIGYNCNIGHNSYIERNTIIIDGATLGGSVKVGENCWIGMNATIREGVKIPNSTMIGMGAVVTKDPVRSGKYFGVPAKYKGVWDGRW